MNEIWKPVIGFEGRYSVSNLGRIKSHLKCRGTNERILNPYPVRGGYLKVDLGDAPTRKTKYVARLVLESFQEADTTRTYVNHKNGDPKDNRLENLEWCNRSENMLHMYRVLGKGKYRPNHRGERHSKAKLTDELVVKFRNMRRDGVAIRQIARTAGMNHKTISHMLLGKTWGHIPQTQAARPTDHWLKLPPPTG